MGIGTKKNTFDVLVLFTDGTEKVIENVDNFDYIPGEGLFWVTINSWRSFIPVKDVKFLGKKGVFKK